MPKTPEAVRTAGSHFLSRDSPWVKRMVEAAALQPGESVLDAGAGVGSITALLAEAVQPGGSVVAVETDVPSAEALRRRELPGTRVVEGDVLKVRLPTPLHAVVANPPFRLLPALLRRLLDHGFGRAVLVMPRELADRLTAQPKTEEYGRLTVEVGVRAKCRILFPLPRKAFDPPPAVQCCVVQVVPKAKAATLTTTASAAATAAPSAPIASSALASTVAASPDIDMQALAAVLEHAWAARRKTLRHSLAPLAAALGLPPQDISTALDLTKTGDRTAVDVSPWEYGQLANHVAAARRARA